MLFKDIKIGDVFFENETGEFHLKLSDKESVIVDRDRNQYDQCEFKPDHEVELEDNFFLINNEFLLQEK
jgi:hypothetical protein